ncbi:Cytochrome b561 [Macleaya cordata]|uniref:Cytochrome b561 n=1 Tax=Macleaya cordata TaxID=56857 RepID=A0A200QW62_MACCD|nr:Cytochrome b561 [Macleaya cordata]
MADSTPSFSPLSFLCFFAALFLILESKFLSVIAGDGSEALDSCNEDISTFLPVPFSNTSGLSCHRVWNTFVLRFSQTDDHIVTIVLSAEYTNGWVGMGFSKDGTMVGSSAMVGWIGKTGRAALKQYYLRGYSASEVISNKGELPLTNIPPAVVLYGAKIYLAYQLKFTNRLTEQAIILAFGSATPIHYKLSKHDDTITIRFDFSGAANNPQNIEKMKKSHGALGLIGWGVILPAGTMVARYCRHWVLKWYYLHTFIQFVGFLIGLAAVVSGKVLFDRAHINVAAHRGIGIFVFVLTILQVLAFFLQPNKDSKIRRYWNWYHHWVGRLLLILGAVNIIIGSCGEDRDCSFARISLPILFIIYFTCAILEVMFCFGAYRRKHDAPAIEVNQIGS